MDDLISRQAAIIEITYNNGEKYTANLADESYENVIACILDDISVRTVSSKEPRPNSTISSIEPRKEPRIEPRQKGEWQYAEGVVVCGTIGNPYGSYRCSACGNCSPHRTSYCPCCGAEMR